jgi:hypothetical protein
MRVLNISLVLFAAQLSPPLSALLWLTPTKAGIKTVFGVSPRSFHAGEP